MPAELDHSVSGKKRQRLASRITAVVCKHAGNCISALSDIKKKKKEPHIHAPQWALKKKKRKMVRFLFFFSTTSYVHSLFNIWWCNTKTVGL